MLTPRFLEWMNGTLFILLIFALGMFSAYIFREVVLNGFQRTRLQAAISIATFLSGESVIRGWIWYWRHLENSGADGNWMEHHPILLAGAIIQIIGTICIIRVFAPDHWGRFVWLASAIFSVCVGTGLLFI